MSIRLKDLPPLSSFLALEAVVRNASFTAASHELRVTQSAISKQVRTLEDHLRVELIRRERPRIRKTPEGDLIASAVRAGTDAIEAAVRSVREQQNESKLSVTAVTALSSLWLMPRLPRFLVRRPKIEVNLMMRDREVQGEDDDFDIGILFSDRRRPGFEMQRLFGDEVLAVCSPAYLRKNRHIRDARDLPKEDLLHLVTDDPWMAWPEWFAACGVNLESSLTGPQFNNYILVVQAALEGQGIALGWRRLVNPMLDRGELVRLTPEAAIPEAAYNVIVPNQRAANRAAWAFRSWLLEEAARDW